MKDYVVRGPIDSLMPSMMVFRDKVKAEEFRAAMLNSDEWMITEVDWDDPRIRSTGGTLLSTTCNRGGSS